MSSSLIPVSIIAHLQTFLTSRFKGFLRSTGIVITSIHIWDKSIFSIITVKRQGKVSLIHIPSIIVIPDKVLLETPRRETIASDEAEGLKTSHFIITCPKTSVWSDEVWIVPQKGKSTFGETTDDELADLADAFLRVTRLFDLRYNGDFPFNFYIYPDGDWYIRIIPRVRVLGGFEVGTNVFVNTQSPLETMNFLKEHFQTPDVDKIMKEHQAEYHRTV